MSHGQRAAAQLIAQLWWPPATTSPYSRDEDEVIGHIVGRRYGPNELHPIITAELESIHVYPAHRGRGVGGLLVSSFLARVAGVDRVTVSAYAHNARALSFYARLGFKVRSVILDLDL